MPDALSSTPLSRAGTPARTALAPAIAQSQQRELDEQRTFGAVLGRAMSGPSSHEDQALDAARGLVTQALVQPVLKGLRESRWAAAPFAPTSGERSMRALLDDHLSQRIVNSENWSLVSKVKDVILRKGGHIPADAAPQGPGAAGTITASDIAPGAANTLMRTLRGGAA